MRGDTRSKRYAKGLHIDYACGGRSKEECRAMKNIFLLLVMTTALAACASNGKPAKVSITDSDCGDSTRGRTGTDLKYGKDDIDMKWKSHVYKDSEFRIKLKPEKDYDGKKVKIVGISSSVTTGPGSSFDWLDIEKSAKELKDAGEKAVLVLCVPKDAPKGTDYKFDVIIEDVGELDPRVEVVN